MAILPLSKDFFDTVTLELNPRRTFISSSAGITGSVYVFAEHSPFTKEQFKLGAFNDAAIDASSLEEFRKNLFETATSSLTGSAASGSLTGSNNPSGYADGLTLIFKDAKGNEYNAQTYDVSGYTPVNSTATKIGTYNTITTATELAGAITESLNQARLYGVGSTAKNATSGELLRIEAPTQDGEKIFIRLLDNSFLGNNLFKGTLVASGGFNTVGLVGGVGNDMQLQFQEYLSRVTKTAVSAQTQKQMEILRFEPTNTFTTDTIRKVIITDSLFPYYRTTYTSTQFAYGNYNSINFFTGAMVPTCSAIIYPSPITQSNNPLISSDDVIWDYNVTTGFTFALNINPRRTIPTTDGEFHASTILHMSSCYALSVVTGSYRNDAGYPPNFRLMLQLSHSANIPPSQVNIKEIDAGTNVFPNDLIFLSGQHLRLNQWKHAAVAWANLHNDHTGAFYFDGIEEEESRFIIPSSSINCAVSSSGETWPWQTFNPLFVGNFYDGPYFTDELGSADAGLKGYFNSSVAAIEGVYDIGLDMIEPSASALSHPCNVEINDIRVYGNYKPSDTILSASREGPENFEDDLKFYLPPFFVKESPKRKVLITPFQSSQKTTESPFNVDLSFGVDGRNSNLQNYCREFKRGYYPRLYFLTASTIDTSTGVHTANQFLWESASFAPMVRARNLLIFPCDNAKFTPNFNLLKSGTFSDPPISGSETSRFINDKGRLDLTLVNLRNLVSTGSIFKGLTQTKADGKDNTSSDGILQQAVGSSPEDPGVSPGSGLTILQRTRDASSNEVVIFDASNLFYGMTIKPGSVVIKDSAITGSGGELSMTLRDNFQGNLYRADSESENCKWNTVGNVLYEEGIFIIKAPTIPYFGREKFEIEFEGIQNIHILEINVPAGQSKINSSSNSSFNNDIKPNDFASTNDPTFVGISGVLLHDDNLNVIARTNLAQPLIKTQADKYVFRIKIDF